MSRTSADITKCLFVSDRFRIHSVSDSDFGASGLINPAFVIKGPSVSGSVTRCEACDRGP